MLYVYKEGIR